MHVRAALLPYLASSRPAVYGVVAAVALSASVDALLPVPSSATGYVLYLREDASSSSLDREFGLATRVESVHARSTRALVDGLRVDSPQPSVAASALAFAPERVRLIEAPDSVAAAAAAARLLRDGIAEWIEPVVPREPAAVSLPNGFPDDPLFRDGRQWGLWNTGTFAGAAGADIRAWAAWRRCCGAPWVTLAIVDSGVDPAHPDLQRALPEGPRLHDGLNVTDDPSGSWADSTAHGTAVAGVMAALTGDGVHFDSLGMAGVCGGDGGTNPGCRLVPLKITSGHATAASSFDIARGILAAVRAGARAVNLSYGGDAPSRLEREALRYAIERGCLVVTASGNGGATSPRQSVYPAAYAADGLCLQVGATDAWDRRAAFSSYGPGLDLVAPGVGVWTTFMSYPSAAGAVYPGYVAVSGTSFAAPFATGTAGLLVAARPELAADDVRELLRDTARDVGDPGPDEPTGRGVLDADAALAAVEPDVGIWHDEVAADAFVDTGVDSLVVGENGPGNMTGPRTWAEARRIEARVTITLPDSFLPGARAWPRIAGTSTVRGDFRVPYFAPHAEVSWAGSRAFVLRGWIYRVAANGDSLDLPLAYDQARFGFTVIGAVRRPELGRPAETTGPRLGAAPNPFATSLRIERPAGATLDVFDLGGRCVRTWAPDGSVGSIVWDGCDASGRRSPPGLYWLRAYGVWGSRSLRVIKLE